MTVAWSYTTTGFTFVGKSAEEIRDICLAAGLSGIEAAPPLLDRLTDAEVEAYRRTFEDAGLKLTTFHLPFTAADDIASFYKHAARGGGGDYRLLDEEGCAGRFHDRYPASDDDRI